MEGRKVLEITGGEGRQNSNLWVYNVADITTPKRRRSLFKSSAEYIDKHYVLSKWSPGKHTVGVDHYRGRADSRIYDLVMNFVKEQNATSIVNKTVHFKEGLLRGR